MIVTHEAVTIEYNEKSNKWCVDSEIFGITFESDSLADAKVRITNSLKRQGEGRFKRFKAWKCGSYYGSGRLGEYLKVEVTSIIPDRKNYDEAWITYPKQGDEKRGQREKVMMLYLYADTPKNAELVKQLNRLYEMRSKLEKDRETLASKLKKIDRKE